MKILVYIIRRAAWLILTLLGVSAIMFVLGHLVPADPARLAAGLEATEAEVSRMRELMGLDKPLLTQFGLYIGDLAQGQLGVSIRNNRPVLLDIRTYLPATIELAVVTIILYTVLGIPLGIVAAFHKGKPIDHTLRILSTLGVGMPSFWLALVLQLLLFSKLGWFPSGGRLDPTMISRAPNITGLLVLDSAITRDWGVFLASLHHLVLPAFTLMLGRLAITMRFTRRSVINTLKLDFVRTARAKGLPGRSLVLRHVVRNSLIPVVTLLGLQTGALLSGTVLVETVFSWPGIGKYAVDAISYLDYPAIMGVGLAITTIFVLVNLVVDIAYSLLDPRIQY